MAQTLLDKVKEIIALAEQQGEHILTEIKDDIHALHDKLFGSATSNATAKPASGSDPDKDGDDDTAHPTETGE